MSDLVVIRGGGDLGSGVAIRLWRCGFRVVILETDRPVAVRRTVSFAEAVYQGRTSVEEVPGCLVNVEQIPGQGIDADFVPVVVNPDASLISALEPRAVVDAIMAKRNLGTSLTMAPTVIALGPGFTAGVDVHAVIETQRGPHLGRVIWEGGAAPDTGVPGEVAGKEYSRVLRAPASGSVRTLRAIADPVVEGDVVAEVGGLPVQSTLSGFVRGLVRDGLVVSAGMKIGDIDPRGDPSLCSLVSDKALAIAGGVLEAILSGRR